MMPVTAPASAGAGRCSPKRISPTAGWWPTLFAAVVAALYVAPASGAEGDFLAVPKLASRVMDTTATLSAGDEARISERIRTFEAIKGGQIAVLIVDSTAPEAIFDYALRVAETWKIGRKGVDDGVLFVVAKSDRKMQILTGPGVQGVLTDAVSKRIIAEIVSPRFREGKFGDGIYNGVDKIASVIDGEALPPPPKKKQASQSSGNENFFFLAILAALFVAPVLRSILGRFLGATATAGVTGVAAWWILGGLLLPAVIGVIVLFVALFAGMFGGRHGGGGLGGFAGGGGGSWSGGGGGGFSGGGGGFDGGGASGDW